MSPSNAEYRKQFRQEVIPKYYSGYVHLLFNAVVLVGICAYSLAQIHELTFWEFLVFPLTMLFGNVVIFLIHKYPLHRYFKPFPYPYTVHTKMHHQFFTHEHPVYENARDFYILFFPPEVVAGFAIGFCGLSYLVLPYFLPKNAVFLFLFGSSLYFILYEILHYISHLPDHSPVLKIKYFNFMRNHHRAHHDPSLMHDYNFDIVFPWCDMVFGAHYKGEGKNK